MNEHANTIETVQPSDLSIIPSASLENQLMASAENSFCTFPIDTEDSKIKLFNAMNSPDHSVSEMINQVITIKDFYAESVELPNAETGELMACVRVVLFDDKGETYSAVSVGIVSSLKKLLRVFGHPSGWVKPLAVKIKQVKVEKGSMLTLELAKNK